jgi:hypothetical protein
MAMGLNKAVRLAGETILITRVNRSSPIDSKVSLDARTAACDLEFMGDQKFNLYLERIDATRNIARYYALSIEPTLFGDAMLLRRWGRIGAWGQQKIHLLLLKPPKQPEVNESICISCSLVFIRDSPVR